MSSRPGGGPPGFRPDPRLAAAFGLLQSGRARDAAAAFSALLRASKPKLAAQAHFGLAMAERGNADMARMERLLGEALRLDPTLLPAASGLADLYRQSGRQDSAIDILAKAAGRSADPLLLFNLGALRMERGAVNAALEDFRRAVKIQPGLGEAWQGLAQAHRLLGELGPASEALRRLVALRPGQPAPLKALVQILVQMARPDALAEAERLVILRPDDAAALDLLAAALGIAGRHADALAMLEAALVKTPKDLTLLFRRADCLRALGRTPEAVDLCEKIFAASSDPAPRAAAQERLGLWALADGDAEAARRHLENVLTDIPSHAGARMRLGALLLSMGTFTPGWRHYDARFEAGLDSGGILPQPFPQKRWRGEDLTGKAILLWSEQGIGDDILLASMIPDLGRRAARVLLVCEPRLVTLLQRSLPANVTVYARSAPPHPDLLNPAIAFQSPMGSIGEFLRPDWASFGTGEAFLKPDPDRVVHFRARYGALPGLKVGLSWRSRNLVNGAHKACDLAEWGPILKTGGISFVNLQYGDCADELDRMRSLYGVSVFHDPEVDQLKDMEGFAAQVASLDLVVGISNAASHVAGALGVSTFVLLSAAPLWLWFRDRTDSPWYASARLFRQQRFGAWDAPVLAVAAATADRVGQMNLTSTIA